MYKSIRVSMKRSPVNRPFEKQQDVDGFIVVEDEIIDPGTEYLVFKSQNDEYSLPLSNVTSSTAAFWMDGLNIVMNDGKGPSYFISKEEFERAMVELDISGLQ